MKELARHLLEHPARWLIALAIAVASGTGLWLLLFGDSNRADMVAWMSDAPRAPAEPPPPALYYNAPSAVAPSDQVQRQPTATATSAGNPRCQLLKDKAVALVTLDWQLGQPLTLYARISGGVPGQEVPIPGDDEPFIYSARWGDYSTDECKFIPGYAERLYCEIQLPSEYGGTLRPFDLYVNGCEQPVYGNARAEVPDFMWLPQGAHNGQGGACTLTLADCTFQGMLLDSASCTCEPVR